MAGNYPPYSGQAEDTTGVPEDWTLQQGGIEEKFFQRDISIGAADGNGAQYAIMQACPADAILTELKLEVDANAAFTQASIGIYDTDTNAVIAIGCYCNNLNVAAGSTKNAPFDGMTALTHSNTTQRLRDLVATALGIPASKLKARYDLVLTAVTNSNAAIIFTVRGRLVGSV